MELKISDGERSRYTQIYGLDPLACDQGLELLGCDIGADFDLLSTPDGQILEAPAMRAGGKVVVQIEKKRDKDASIFCVMVKS